MNKERRKELQNILDEISLLQERLSCCRDEEQEAFDCMPENLQGGERGQKTEENISYLEDACTDLENAIENINQAIE